MAAVRRALLLDAPQLGPGAVRARRAATACALRPAPLARTLVTTARRQQQATHKPHGPDSPNAAITRRLAEYKGYLEDHGALVFRVIACSKAIAVLEQQTHPVQSGAEAEKLKGIGPRLAKKIDEIISTGKLNALAPERVEAVEELKKVSGMSQEQAEEFVDGGVKSLADLKRFESMLDERQRLGLAAVNDFSQEMSAAEVEAIEGALRRAGTEWDPTLTIHLVGPRARGQPVTGKGELEFLLVHPLYTNEEAAKYPGSANCMLTSFAEKLRTDGLMVENVSPVEADTYFAVIKTPGSNVRRLVTLRGCTVEQYPMALLCMTQPPEFEAKMKKHASERGLKCERFELFLDDPKDTVGGHKRKKTAEAMSDGGEDRTRKLPVKSEEDLLKQLGLEDVPLISGRTAAPRGTIQ